MKTNGPSLNQRDAHHSRLLDPGLGASADEDMSASAPIVAISMLDENRRAYGDAESGVITGGPFLFLPSMEGDAVVAGQLAEFD